MTKTKRNLRILIGVVIILIGVYYESYLGALGVVPIIFAIIGYCPVCAINQKRSSS